MKQFITKIFIKIKSILIYFGSHILADISYQLLCSGIHLCRKLSSSLVRRVKAFKEKFSHNKVKLEREEINYDENDKK